MEINQHSYVFIFFVNIVKEWNSSYFPGYLTHEAPDLL